MKRAYLLVGAVLFLSAPTPGGDAPAGGAATAEAETAGPPELKVETRLHPRDGAPFDHFGYAVAVSGEAVVGGAPDNDHAGHEAGAAYLFHRAGAGWRQTTKLTAGDAEAFDRFGIAVAVSDDTVAVGAHGEDDGGAEAGAAYVFGRTGAGWRQTAKLTAGDAAPGDRFGHAVAVSGDTLVVGAPGQDAGGEGAGAVYVFRRRGATWHREARLLAEDAESHDLFGFAVALSGATAVVGAYADDDAGRFSGAAYVFRRQAGTWRQEAKLVPEDGWRLDEFGVSVAASGDTVLVGSHGSGPTDRRKAGAAYVFRRRAGAWRQEAKLVAHDRAAADRFGKAVALSGERAVVGAHFADPAGIGSGAAYLFQRRGTAWHQTAKLNSRDAEPGAEFGVAVALSGATAVIGALRASEGGTAAGSVYVYAGSEASQASGRAVAGRRPREADAGVPAVDGAPGGAGAGTRRPPPGDRQPKGAQ